MKNKIEITAKFINRLLADKRLLIAIDGRCAAGKTTFAKCLQGRCESNVFHMDDFFLPPTMRTEERLNEPGGNVDYERFLYEVLLPLYTGQSFIYHPYDCKTQTLKAPVRVSERPVNIIEGAYSCHPVLREYYDLNIFMTVNSEEQLRRIMIRNGSDAKQFKETWIPLEEKYFKTYSIEHKCDLSFHT